MFLLNAEVSLEPVSGDPDLLVSNHLGIPLLSDEAWYNNSVGVSTVTVRHGDAGCGEAKRGRASRRQT